MGSLQYCDWCKHARGDNYNSIKASLDDDYDKSDYICDRCSGHYKIFRQGMIASVIPQICYKEQDD